MLDFSHALAGPYCTLLLAGYGATVYKIESPSGGDTGRTWGPPFFEDQAAFFLGVNRGKQGVCIDLKRPEGVELCLRMVEKADVLLENFRPGTLQRLGLGYAAARARNPRLIYCSISGYGQNGPSRDRAAMDLILQASSGLLSITGTEDGREVRSGHSVADITAGMFALIGILMAVHARDKTGLGQFIDVSMFDSMISAMTSNFMYYIGSGVVPRPMGTTFAAIVPYRTFQAMDREIAMAVGSEKLWDAFCRVIGHPELIDHADYRSNALRVRNRTKLEPFLAAIFREDTAANWFTKLSEAGIPAAPVATIADVVNDPQSAARAMFPQHSHPTAGPLQATGLPLKFSETPGNALTAAPLLGQHTQQALTELLDLDSEQVKDLEARGVILRTCVAGAARQGAE